MPITFEDTFDRPDGAPGNGWIADGSAWAINAHRVGSGSASRCHNTTQPSTADHCQRIWVIPPASGSKQFTLYFRVNSPMTQDKFASFSVTPTTVTVTVGYMLAGVNHTLDTNTKGFTWGETIDLMAAVAGSQIIAWVDHWQIAAAMVVEVIETGLAAMGVGQSAAWIDAYALYDTGGIAFTVSAVPSSGNQPEYDVTLTNGGADWTPGTPGEPTFAVGAGTITSQVVVDANTATLVYVPPTIDAQTNFYDPQNDFYFQIGLSTSLAGVGGGGGGGGLTTEQALTMAGLQLLLGEWDQHEGILSGLYLNLGLTNSKFADAYTPASGGALGALLDAILADDGRLATIDAQSYSAMSVIGGATNAGAWTLETVWQYVQGTGAHTIADVMDAIAALGAPTGGDLTTILEQLALIRTANMWTLGHVMDAIAALPDPSTALTTIINNLWEIRTVAHSYTLGDVMTAIAGIGSPDLSAVLDAIAAVRGSGNPDLAAVLTAIALIPTTSYSTQLTAIKDAIDAVPTNPITSLQSVLDAIGLLSTALSSDLALVLAAIEALTPATPIATPPVWPGLAKATLGTPVALATGVTIAEAMDGVIVNIASAPTKQGYFTFDDVRSWRNIGAVSFYSDTGAQEYPQGLGFESALYCPKVMVRAAGVKVRCASGVTGTVTPWTINAT